MSMIGIPPLFPIIYLLKQESLSWMDGVFFVCFLTEDGRGENKIKRKKKKKNLMEDNNVRFCMGKDS